MSADDSYAEVPYPTPPVRCTHPEILAVVGALSGLRPAPVDRCRVLEIGCGDGGNLLSMACGLPGAEFVGIEPSAPALARAADAAEALGVRNVRFERKGVEELDEPPGSYDYVVTHGVFSWVAPDVQEKILEVSARMLRPDGLAYVSYNTFPGWHARGMVREMMLYHVRNESSPSSRTANARDFLARLSDAVGATEKGGHLATDLEAYGALLRHERDLISRYPEPYFYHEHLERVNLPVYFHEFIARAARHGLKFVSEAFYSSSQSIAYGAPVADVVRSLAKDPMEIQQLLDFASNRAFRQSVLCRSDRPTATDPGAVRSFHVSSPVRSVSFEDAGETFGVPWGWTLTTSDPALRKALTRIGEGWPAPVSFRALEGDAGGPGLASSLFDAFSRGLVEFQAAPPRFTKSTGGRPCASPLARLQATSGKVVTNLRHEQVSLDELSRSWLVLLDGTRDAAGVLSALSDDGKVALQTADGATVTDPAERRRMLSEGVDAFLRNMADAALLAATSA